MDQNIGVRRSEAAPSIFLSDFVPSKLLAVRSSPITVMVAAEHSLDSALSAHLSSFGSRFLLSSFRELNSHAVETLSAELVIIDVDWCGGPQAVVPRLLRFRRSYPEIGVLLLSRKFEEDDTSLERLPICDASLRLPSTPGSVSEVFDAIVWNNAVWRIRFDRFFYSRRAHIRNRR